MTSGNPIQKDVSLLPFNSLRIAVHASQFASVHSLDELLTVLPEIGASPPLVIGGGSNLVLTRNIPGMVILNRLRGIELICETRDWVEVWVAAGENWDAFVAYSLEQSWFGLENLSAIPGSVGAAPIQNIGAYGVELIHVLHRVETIDIVTGNTRCFNVDECELGYRDSVFKRELKNRYIITALVLRLHKHPQLQLGYGEIRRHLADYGYDELTLTSQDLRHVITQIRSEKLPDPEHWPNVGSFFKNPLVPLVQFFDIKKQWPNVMAFDFDPSHKKLAAGWLIDQLGWKGKRLGDAQVHEQQALVLINHGTDSKDLLELSRVIQQEVLKVFGVQLEVEPSIV